MRKFLILAPLGLLVLASCKPAGGSSSSGISTSQDTGGEWVESLGSNEVSNAQIFALSSLRTPPPPRELAGAINGTCPIHHQKMSIKEVPLVYQETASFGNQSAPSPAVDEFPFAVEELPSPTNILLPGEPLTARVFRCESCVTARKLADRKRSASSPAVESE